MAGAVGVMCGRSATCSMSPRIQAGRRSISADPVPWKPHLRIIECTAVRAILDTSVLISSWHPPSEDAFAISVVSLAEMHFGVLRAARTPGLAARVRRLSEVEHEFEPIPVDGRVARSYAELAHAVVRAGQSPRPRVFDLVIAATARVEGARLYTLNPADFTGLEDFVEVVKPLP